MAKTWNKVPAFPKEQNIERKHKIHFIQMQEF